MPDLNNLLDQIDRLDQQATKGPWQNDGDEILGAPYKECGYLKAPHVGETYETERDAEFIALARTFAPAAAKALRAVLDVADDMSDRAGKTFAIADRTGVEDGKAQAFLRAAVMVRNAITNGFEDDDALGADRE